MPDNGGGSNQQQIQVKSVGFPFKPLVKEILKSVLAREAAYLCVCIYICRPIYKHM